MIHAVIGIGSNSTRMLVGKIEQGNVAFLRRMREGTRLFSGLSEGMLSQQSIVRTADAVARFVRVAHEDGAEGIHIIATSAARDAKNGVELKALVEAAAGVPLEIITGEEEARLSFLGGTEGARAGMIDIGGGSTEIAVGGGNVPFSAGSAQLGARRLFAEKPILLGNGFDEALSIARERVAGVWEGMNVPLKPVAWYGVGGTMTNLASLDLKLPQYDREAVAGHSLKRETVENWARRLSKLTQAERLALPGIIPERADIIPHGAVALLGAMQALDISRVIVSNRTNLDGYLYDLAGREATEEEDSVRKVQTFYDASVETEWTRLERHLFEFEINKRYIDRYAKPGDRVLDVGGGPGRYSLHMASRGVDVTLLDLSEGNCAFARAKAAEMGLPLKTICADARTLDQATEGQFDTILLMGPLYHLLDEADRVSAVNACLRRLKPGGVLCVAFISTVGGLVYSGRELPESILWENEDVFYQKIMNREDYAGAAFTQAFFIEPGHVLPFMAKFPLEKLHLVGSESITAPFHDKLIGQPRPVIDKWLEVALALCEREEFLSYTEHFLYIGRKKEEETR